ncbi:acyl-protein synthetase [Acetobacterium fimetarium]|uniref:Acyl-protein synthetase n=1 Tax=Acetobacterium fimetarium TaxID=52691 RepID=A0ABR6WWE8_9FIRM|nr:acyl-protein synthetase [Acetobacterium fimetarium]MBC3804833.1 acyl-protein synthetase [Acetobacterium fimetarium]
MIDYEKILNIPPYAYDKKEKEAFLTEILKDLTKHHYQNCSQYKGILDALNFNSEAGIRSYQDIPFLPVSLFKKLELKSIKDEEIFKTMTSSGTTGQAVSKIYLDKETASHQQKTLVKIVSNFTGSSRMPMLIIDCPSVVKNRAMFSARGAGILGFSIFGANKTYALDDDMNLNLDAIETFLEKHQGKPILLFGFTFMIWQHFYKELKKQNKKIDLSQGILIHGGGWKKLQNESVNPQAFKDALRDVSFIKKIYDYYGMVEQTGCVYMECEEGHLHASIFSDILTRRSIDFTPCDIGETGIIEVVSILPKSYPGHVLLTEDEGVILGEDDCPCGRSGKYFKIHGRLKNAEIRGCSDTYGPQK